ncbi:MAG: RNA polymerase sigma factor RpoD/SigA [Bacteroidota bacterium]
MRQLKISRQLTNRDTPAFEKYLQEVSREQLITAEEEVLLSQRIRQGDSKALDKLTRANLRFVISVSKQYQNYGLSLPDLINEGNMGLIKAAQRFDETRGFKFISYAVWWIRQSIMQAIAEQSRIVRLPLNKITSINKIKKAYSQLEQELQREPNAEEISLILDLPIQEVMDSIKNSSKHVSMDAPLVQDEDINMYDLLKNDDSLTPESKLMLDSLKSEIERAISTLTTRESQILRHFYGLNHLPQLTLEEIAEKFDLTRERVRQIKEKSLKKLKNNARCKNLKPYLG